MDICGSVRKIAKLKSSFSETLISKDDKQEQSVFHSFLFK